MGHIRIEQWIRPEILARHPVAISSYRFDINQFAASNLLFLAPLGHSFYEFGVYRPFVVAQGQWLSSDAYEESEGEIKKQFRKLKAPSELMPQIGTQTPDRLHLSVPIRNSEAILGYFSEEASQLGEGALLRGLPWSGWRLVDCPAPQWPTALVDWEDVRALDLSERMNVAESLLEEIVASENPRALLPPNIGAKLAVSIGLQPLPAKGTYVAQARQFNPLHLLRARIVRGLRSPIFFGAVLAHLNNPVDDQSADEASQALVSQWRCELTGYLDEARVRYPFLSTQVERFFC